MPSFRQAVQRQLGCHFQWLFPPKGGSVALNVCCAVPSITPVGAGDPAILMHEIRFPRGKRLVLWKTIRD